MQKRKYIYQDEEQRLVFQEDITIFCFIVGDSYSGSDFNQEFK